MWDFDSFREPTDPHKAPPWTAEEKFVVWVVGLAVTVIIAACIVWGLT